MKWGRKKKQSFSGSSRPFVISQVLPWMSKFKQMGIDSGRGDLEMKQKGKGNSVSGNSVSGAGKFYGGDDGGGAFWRLSFGEAEEEFCSVKYDDDSDDDGVRFQQPSCRNCTLNPEELEELLACYLTLNSDEYHDLIIKVFKQVWFDMSRAW